MAPPPPYEVATEIINKKNLYTRFADTQQWDSMKEIMHPSITLTFELFSGEILEESGVKYSFDNIQDWIDLFKVRNKDMQAQHLVSPPHLEQMNENEVEAVFTVIFLCGSKDLTKGWKGEGGGWYYETWTREEGSGEWRMKKLRMVRNYWKVTVADES
ncbi:hypothetical protein QBC35DRAFT_490770 [Podospora australis]|uniref:SnoaL-like domain-containing protein n=1 Tax=Podospora australis TaxID=1536484 RepID=A0AAN6X285_9PEZI|nr:hypothetical protein QBC35DRAFT_490770 [Podospora australis]